MRNTHNSPRQLVKRLEQKYQTKLRIRQNQTIFHLLWDKVTDIRSRRYEGERVTESSAFVGYEYLAR